MIQNPETTQYFYEESVKEIIDIFLKSEYHHIIVGAHRYEDNYSFANSINSYAKKTI